MKHNVEAIRQEAVETKKRMKILKKTTERKEIPIAGLILFCDKVLFLCKEIERRDKK